ncbi:hypothetical protein L8S00_17220 [Vibrio splendidus]|nr:hypothetical protein [Vibrio splendidus]MDH5905137.1 hypothetical protein [Vibrio splendidus]
MKALRGGDVHAVPVFWQAFIDAGAWFFLYFLVCHEILFLEIFFHFDN